MENDSPPIPKDSVRRGLSFANAYFPGMSGSMPDEMTLQQLASRVWKTVEHAIHNKSWANQQKLHGEPTLKDLLALPLSQRLHNALYRLAIGGRVWQVYKQHPYLVRGRDISHARVTLGDILNIRNVHANSLFELLLVLHVNAIEYGALDGQRDEFPNPYTIRYVGERRLEEACSLDEAYIRFTLVLERISEKTRSVIHLRTSGQSRQEIADLLAITEERVRQLERKGIRDASKGMDQTCGSNWRTFVVDAIANLIYESGGIVPTEKIMEAIGRDEATVKLLLRTLKDPHTGNGEFVSRIREQGRSHTAIQA